MEVMAESAEKHLVSLLNALRSEESVRGGLRRESADWQSANARLDDLNRQVMHLAAYGTEIRQSIGSGLDVELDSRPEDDLVFRASVLASLRETVRRRVTEQLARRTAARVEASTDLLRSTMANIEEAQIHLRRSYPAATVEAHAIPSASAAIGLRADRDGHAA
jgi:predicted transcriptional regulator